ncbi:sensor histidine kinase [Williamsia sp. CHRR-6]|uniref:sensor histidine kinase n=1 Tax=Williamsia sp. CHRR-6 TaxID=2835871 RepID=UPI001BDA8FCC|nr:histidine kinase [Williamsia sp. CHRR-6]MBT0567536.1 histidine kinase [Williamsia sp. CHRR-6]
MSAVSENLTRRVSRSGRWLPGEVRAELSNDPHPLVGRRSVRDHIVDGLMVLFALGIGLIGLLELLDSRDWPNWVVAVNLIGLFGTSIALLWRRRWPLPIAVVLVVLALPLAGAGGAAYVALFSLAVHRPLRYAIPVAVGAIGTTLGYTLIFGSPQPLITVTAFTILSVGVAVAWGTSVRNRRQLLLALAERARRAEAEQRERAVATRATERERLAREMHDVLAHRMSLLSVHAGALEYRPDAPPEEIARAAGVIRSGVHQMLEDLRDVIGMLRNDSDDLAQQATSVARIPALVEEAREAGNAVHATVEVDAPREVPGVVGRAVYRVVQEGLTNARKHGGPVPVTLEIRGGPGRGIEVVVSQPLNGTLTRSEIPGTGTGLTGLNERVTLAGGTLTHGVIEHRFVLCARLPWERGIVSERGV